MTWRQKTYNVVFGTTTKAGRNFDLILLVLILLSVAVVMYESIPAYRMRYGEILHIIELGFTLLFTAEYIMRIIISPKPLRYITSFWGIIDLLSILPTFIMPLINGIQSLPTIRALRLLRLFRILQLSRFTSETQILFHSLKASSYKILVFLFTVVLIMVLTGTLMFIIEDGKNGFDSIPASIYWAVVTVSTVGFGDVTPHTDLGKFLASAMMIMGYAIIAVPTGLITVEMAKYKKDDNEENDCPNCGHDNPYASIYCNQCGKELLIR